MGFVVLGFGVGVSGIALAFRGFTFWVRGFGGSGFRVRGGVLEFGVFRGSGFRGCAFRVRAFTLAVQVSRLGFVVFRDSRLRLRVSSARFRGSGFFTVLGLKFGVRGLGLGMGVRVFRGSGLVVGGCFRGSWFGVSC